MSIGKPEKICKPCSLGYKRSIKKFTGKKRRQLERRFLDDSPIKIGNYGWSE